MIISKPPNRVYDEQWERIYGRKPTDSNVSSNEDADKLNKGFEHIGELPEITTTGAE